MIRLFARNRSTRRTLTGIWAVSLIYTKVRPEFVARYFRRRTRGLIRFGRK